MARKNGGLLTFESDASNTTDVSGTETFVIVYNIGDKFVGTFV